ncbi:hypothetical protein PJU52_000589 [Klebsiella michiganensis]|uniref:hypothetical protein n=2 Tax=Klebsiella michiganensis TaxID=1134687 RepID=UPI0018C7B961|nr:hypothetical protein [Klebsiella michiganensis]EKV7895130.1 hypothetical protein [Klebsiella michiganensis]MBG2620527.1 hypothetical protein [Klebsiella michiganensis]MBG2631934.1 hypothetical protein [Klebsiella michiganensis]MCW9668045.1 hypothetical protein [Klebsiella michiganensis]
MSFIIKKSIPCSKYYPDYGIAVDDGTEEVDLTVTVVSVDSLSALACTVNYVVETGGVKSPYAQFTFDYAGGNPLTEAEAALTLSMNS